jgi:DNA-binding CsgD family transcriptional regulator
MARMAALMYLKSISEFIKFLGDQERTIEEVLAHMVLRVMAPLEATSAFVAKLDNQNSILTIGRYGINGDLSSQYEDCFSLSDRLPITDAIRQRKIILINTLPQWPAEYSELLDSPYHSEELALIAFPIEKSGTPVAVAAVFLDARLEMDTEKELFIQSIAHLLSMYLTQQEVAESVAAKKATGPISSTRPQASGDLTQRQLLILRMISEGRTNIAIGDLLKYSESTIRQETIKIFSKLECDGRVEASELYKTQQLKVQASA